MPGDYRKARRRGTSLRDFVALLERIIAEVGVISLECIRFEVLCRRLDQTSVGMYQQRTILNFFEHASVCLDVFFSGELIYTRYNI